MLHTSLSKDKKQKSPSPIRKYFNFKYNTSKSNNKLNIENNTVYYNKLVKDLHEQLKVID